MAHRHPKIQFTHPIEAQALALKRSMNRKEGIRPTKKQTTARYGRKQQEEEAVILMLLSCYYGGKI